ncbi:MAG: hypothetical protein AAGU77_04140 [Bacillota bacterium]
MSIEISGNPVHEAQSIHSINAKHGAQTASFDVNEVEAYAVSKSDEKPNQFSIDYDKVRALKSDYRKSYGTFKQMVSTLLQKQGQKSQDLMNKIFGGKGDFENITDLGEIMASLDVDDETRAQAVSLIGEDGEWGVKQVSQNILDFAKAVSGSDTSKIEEMKEAFLKGFSEAERVWGGALPEISYRTKEAVLAGFQEWENRASDV